MSLQGFNCIEALVAHTPCRHCDYSEVFHHVVFKLFAFHRFKVMMTVLLKFCISFKCFQCQITENLTDDLKQNRSTFCRKQEVEGCRHRFSSPNMSALVDSGHGMAPVAVGIHPLSHQRMGERSEYQPCLSLLSTFPGASSKYYFILRMSHGLSVIPTTHLFLCCLF